MRDSWSGIDARLRSVEDALADLGERLGRLERGREAASAFETPDVAVDTTTGHRDAWRDAAPARSFDYLPVLSLIGRTCVVFGGAFLLRALTESGRLPGSGGVALGLAYALIWLGVADRVGRRHPLSGLFHGASAVLIALPILWEASRRFHLLAPPAVALVLGGIATVALFVAWRREFQLLAAITVLSVVVAAPAFAVAGNAPVPFSMLLLALTFGVWWMSDAPGWLWLRWPAGLGAVMMVAVLAARAGVAPPVDPPWFVLATAVLLGAGVPAMVAARVVARGRAVDAFAFVQSGLALAVCIIAARALAASISPSALGWIDGFMMLGAAVAYASTVAIDRSAANHARTFFYGSTVALLLGVWSVGLTLSGASRNVGLAVLAMTSALAGRRMAQPAFAVHAAIYATAAAVSTGLITRAGTVWLGAPAAWPPLAGAMFLALAAALVVLAINRRGPVSLESSALTLVRLAMTTLVVIGAGTSIVLLVGPVLAGTPPEPGRFAAFKTVIAAGGAVALSVVPRRLVPEARRLVYPVLVAGAVKVLIEDVRMSSPAMLFLAFAAYGTALIVAARRGPQVR